jgi:hypothetical protein
MNGGLLYAKCGEPGGCCCRYKPLALRTRRIAGSFGGSEVGPVYQGLGALEAGMGGIKSRPERE